MKILMVGGGSGGHVTPVVAVCKELQTLEPAVELRFWCDRAFERQARAAVVKAGLRIRVDTIAAGKLRRYHSMPLYRQLMRLRTIVGPNLRDLVRSFLGLVQSFGKLIVWRPDVIFLKGGYVCLPVGLVAHWLRVPFVIHDSDVHPGLTNRILAKWALSIATGAPLEHYRYPKDRAVYAGIPVDAAFHVFTKAEKQAAKHKLGFPIDKPLLTVTGGGLGAKTLNDAVVAVLDELLPVTSVLLISGTSQYQELKERTSSKIGESFQLHAFISGEMAEALGAADVVMARAGATTLLELAALGAPTILVPNPYLTGGHQLKNAAAYESHQAVVVLNEERVVSSPHDVLDTVVTLVNHPSERQRLSKAIQDFAVEDAALVVAKLILAAARPTKNRKLVQ